MATDTPTEGTAPILGTPADFPDRPPGRGRFVAYAVIGLIVAVMAGGWGYVLLAAHGNPEVAADVVTFDASAPDSATITFVVHKPADRAASCRVRAMDVSHGEVGALDVPIPRGETDVSLTERLRTNGQATTVHVQYCDLV
ncbi:DUF4307 domain-containing protein [Streptosporangiaceae bacterium NEAU-GS5]|nr:DUF4307 domain-containing protein [Streptosporangiaceae bacterium NEAU-GS5]